MTKILIIEDEHVLNDMYAMKFTKEGFDVTSSYDGLAWLTQISHTHPDVILLDIMMPGMNGFETLEAIRMQTSSTCKIIMFTNVVDQEKLNEALSMGADWYLIKSNTTPADAVKAVKNILGQAEKTNPTLYVQPGMNHLKMKNPNGWADIDVDIHINI